MLPVPPALGLHFPMPGCEGIWGLNAQCGDTYGAAFKLEGDLEGVTQATRVVFPWQGKSFLQVTHVATAERKVGTSRALLSPEHCRICGHGPQGL